MVDYEKIGKRIQEERKYILKISQERMAEELGMYQADISNIEKAKKGSGITDLDRLDYIADYLGLSLRTLLFGGEDNMQVYTGEKMTLKMGTGKIRKEHRKTLERLMGIELDSSFPMRSHDCGFYTIYYAVERLCNLGVNEETGALENQESVPRFHFYVFYKSEIVAIMSAFITSVMEHVFQPRYKELLDLIPPDMFDIRFAMNILNPYKYLYENAELEEEQKEYLKLLLQRMDALRAAGEDRCMAYVDGIYVKEGVRQKGIMRMCIDLLKQLFPGCAVWLNLMPVSDESLDYEEAPINHVYSVANVGQHNINAAIAEKLGFTVDPSITVLQAKTIDTVGTEKLDLLKARTKAYYLPQELRNIIADDGELVTDEDPIMVVSDFWLLPDEAE